MMNNYYNPGQFELYYGPMKSGKSKALMDRLLMFDYMQDIKYLIVKPDIDSRNEGLFSRCYDNRTKECLFTNTKNPYQLLDDIKKLAGNHSNYGVIAIDEIQFFNKGIDDVIMELLKQDKHVIAAGLNTDWRGETFGPMGDLLAKAHKTYPLYGVCEYQGCHAPSVRTQKLTNGNPTPYSDLVIEIENSKDTINYETRCFKHHEVPRLK